MEKSKIQLTYKSDLSSATAKGEVTVIDESEALQQLIKNCGIDTRIWKVTRFKISKGNWQVPMKLKTFEKANQVTEERPHIAEANTYRIEAVFERIIPVIDLDLFTETLKESLNKSIRIIKPKPYSVISDNIVIFHLSDLHLGKLAWAKETGKNYDVKIAQQMFKEALNDLISHSLLYKPEKAYLIVGNDVANYDKAYPFPQTTAGTPQEADIRWQKMFTLIINLYIEAIATIQTVIPIVEIINVPGNHAFQTEFYIGEVLRFKFQGLEPYFIVNNLPESRKYIMYGKNLVGLAHGKWEVPQNLHSLMSTDPIPEKYWHKSKFRYFYLGDKHHEIDILAGKSKLKIGEDFNGVKIEYATAISLTDSYEAMRGWRSISGASAMIHNYKHGRIAKIGHNF